MARPRTAWRRYGDPEATSLSVVERDESHAVLELRTGGFYARPDSEDGGVWLSIPGFEETRVPGAPALPMKLAWLEAVAGRKVQLVSVVATRRGRIRRAAAGDHRRAGACARPRTASCAHACGVVPRIARSASSDSTRRRRPSCAASPSRGTSRRRSSSSSPLRWDRTSGRLVLARRLRVHVLFGGPGAWERSRGGSHGRGPRRGPKRRIEGVVARLGGARPRPLRRRLRAAVRRARRAACRLRSCGSATWARRSPTTSSPRAGRSVRVAPLLRERRPDGEPPRSGAGVRAVARGRRPADARRERRAARIGAGVRVVRPALRGGSLLPAGPAAGGEPVAVGRARRARDQELPARSERQRPWAAGAARGVAAGRHRLRRGSGPPHPREPQRHVVGEASWDGEKPYRLEADVPADVAGRRRQPARDRERWRHGGRQLARVPRPVRAARGAAAGRERRCLRGVVQPERQGRDPRSRRRLAGARHDRARGALARRRSPDRARREPARRRRTPVPGRVAERRPPPRRALGPARLGSAARASGPTTWFWRRASSSPRPSRCWSSASARDSRRWRSRSRTCTTSSGSGKRTPRP